MAADRRIFSAEEREASTPEHAFGGFTSIDGEPDSDKRIALQRNERLRAGCLRLWRVIDGLVALCVLLPDGRRQVISLSTPGDVVCPVSTQAFGEIWVEALTPSEVVEIDLAAQHCAIGRDAGLTSALFAMVHQQVKCASAHLVTLGRLDGMERVCLFLADMAWRIGVDTPGGKRVHLPLSREDIADYLGLNAETVSRIFSRVKKAKLALFLSPTDYLVTDIAALEDRAPLSPSHRPANNDDAVAQHNGKAVVR